MVRLVKPTPAKGTPGKTVASVDGRSLLLDLLANAVRRAEMEFKYDDAVARFYIAAEKLTKTRLQVAHDIDNSDADPDVIPGVEFPCCGKNGSPCLSQNE